MQAIQFTPGQAYKIDSGLGGVFTLAYKGEQGGKLLFVSTSWYNTGAEYLLTPEAAQAKVSLSN